MHDYKEYSFGRKEFVLEFILAAAQVIFTGILFFRSWIGCVLLSPAVLFRLGQRKNFLKERRLSMLRLDFREVILSMAASLHAGYSLEQSVGLALEDLKRLFPGEKRPMMEELYWMLRNMEIKMSAEQLFEELAFRSGLEEIRSYGAVLTTVRRQGGNLVSISQETAGHISDKIQVQMEIEQLIAGKKLEKKIMFCMPYFILIYLQLANPSYLEPLFHNLYGASFMFLCLVAIYGAGWWADRIINITI